MEGTITEMELSPREKEFCKWFLVARGDYHKIAKYMNIEWNTVQTHRRHIFEKKGVSDKISLMYLLLEECYAV